MAAILELLLKEQTSPSLLIPWLRKELTDEGEVGGLAEYSKLRTEFVPFFLNYLRDQSLPLLQSSKASNPSPAKTPTNLKLKKKSDFLKQDAVSSSSRKPGGNRVQLFSASPLENKASHSDVFSLASPNSSLDSPSLLEWTNKKNVPGAKKGAYNRTSPQHDWSQKGQKHSPNCATPDHQRFKYKQTLGDFLSTPDSGDYKKKKSPHWSKQQGKADGSPSPGVRRRSGGRGKGRGSSEPMTRVMKVTPVSSPPIFSLNNLEDFPPVMTGPVQESTPCVKPESMNTSSTPSRRITPTPIKERITPTPSSGGRRVALTTIETRPMEKSSDIHPAFRSAPVKTVNFDEERENIRKELIAKRSEAMCTTPKPDSVLSPSGKPSTNLSTTTPTKMKLQRMSSISDIVQADRLEVTHDDKLNILINIYSGILNEPLVSNITVELYFLVQLLTVRGCTEDEPDIDYDADVDEIIYFSNVHNVVYFAVSVLENQSSFLSLLERSTLRLLMDNPRIGSFSPDLKETLAVAYESTAVKVFPSTTSAIFNRISFQADTDNKRNFPNDKSFHLFKKQRDIFYELLREWEDNHLNPDWSMKDKMTGRIQALVNCGPELTNHVHFARLFQSQLIEMCKGDSSLKLEGGEDNIALLAKLKQSNPEKFKRLQERFITPYSVNGPSPPPAFQGCQKFFCTFIMLAANYSFYRHLSDSMYCKISELNSLQLPLPESDAQDNDIDQETRDSFISGVLTLRLLGKFLGLVSFLPYRTPEKLPEPLIASVIEVRNLVQGFQVDLLYFLQSCISEGRITYSLPWIVEYLSMADPVAISLDYYKALMVLLIQIYKSCKKEFKKRRQGLGMLMVIVLLGWLFEIPSFPDGLFFTYDVAEIVDLEIERSSDGSSISLDELDLVDHQLLYTCCPYLGEVRSLLVEFAVGLSSRNNQIRKITPISADSQAQTSVSEKQMQMQLEENFFHNHPASMKKCVEFVADRVSSNYIKRYRAKVLPEFLRSGTEKIGDLVSGLVSGQYRQDKKEQLGVKLFDSCVGLAEKARINGIANAPEFCEENIKNILPQMLPEDISQGVLTMASQISQRLAVDRVNQWMVTHITPNMFNKELSPELDKQVKDKTFVKAFPEAKLGVGESGREVVVGDAHHTEQVPPSDCLGYLKDLAMDVLFQRRNVTEDECLMVLKQIYNTLTLRQDAILAIQRSFGLLTKDLACSIASSYPQCLSDKVIQHFIKIWRGPLYDYIQPHTFLCYKHLYYLDGAINYLECWTAYSKLIKSVVEARLVSPQCIGKCVLSIVQQPLELETLERLSTVVCDVVTILMSQGTSIPDDLLQAVDWLFQLCGEQSDVTDSLSETLDKMKLVDENSNKTKLEGQNSVHLGQNAAVT